MKKRFPIQSSPQGVRLSLAVKMIAAFLLVIFPILFGNMFIYFQGSSILIARSQSSINYRQDYLANYMETIFSSVYTGHMNLILETDINYLITLYNVVSDYQKYQMVENVKNSLDVFVVGNNWVEGVKIYIPSINRMVQSEKGMSEPDENYAWLCETAKEHYVTFSHLDGNFIIITREGSPQEIQYLTVVEISSEKITELFAYLYSQHEIDTILASSDGFVFSQIGQSTVPEFGNHCFLASKDLPEGKIQDITIDGKEYLLRRDDVFFDNLTLISAAPYDLVFSDINSYQLLFEIFFPISLILCVFFVVFFFRIINRPVLELNRAFSAVRSGEFSVRVQISKGSDFSQLYSGFNYMVQTIQELIRSNYRQRILVQQAELRQLHAQVDPHFLHNGFLNICSMAQMEDYEGIEEMALKLSQYYQYVSRADQNKVTLQEEYRFVSLYADIQNIRFGERVVCQIAVLPETFRALPFPRFCLQNLVENSYKYGAGTREQGEIEVSFSETSEEYCICVSDNGDHFTKEKLDELNHLFEQEELLNSGTGLYNTYQRIQLFYHNGSRLKLSIGEKGGMQAIILIRKPVESGEETKNVSNFTHG